MSPRFIGAAIGAIFALVWAALGFGWAILAVVCASLGYAIGVAFENGVNLGTLTATLRERRY